MNHPLAAGFHIKPIQASQTWPIRQTAMWPDHPIAFVKLDKDESGLHLGLFSKKKLISVISVFVENKEAQFRKFATLPSYQGLGFGSQLLRYTLAYLATENIKKVWCNARLEKTNFYERFGLQTSDRFFHRAGKAYVVMEKHL